MSGPEEKQNLQTKKGQYRDHLSFDVSEAVIAPNPKKDPMKPPRK
jgi:hypothetical protein